MSEGSSSRKRQRTSDTSVVKSEALDDNTLPTLSALNYEDGNVIIKTYTHFTAAEMIGLYRIGRISTSSTDEAVKVVPPDGVDGLIKYRIHRGIIASHSNVFADYFRGKDTILNNHAAQCEGVHVFTVDDPHLDLDDFLNIIYTPEYISDTAAQSDRITLLRTLSKILNAAKRFDSPSVRMIVKNYLERQYPSRISYWNLGKFMEISPAVTAATIRIAVDHKIGSILPILLYHLSTTLGVFDGFAAPNQRADFDNLLAGLTARETRILYGGSSTLYSQSDFRMEKLAALDECAACTRPSESQSPPCVEVFDDIVRPGFALRGSPHTAYRTRFPLDRFDQIEDTVGRNPNICADCKKVFIRETTAAKLQLWRDIPRIFDVVDLVGEAWGSV